jgi:ABC-type dipeptide/oligopeptide/nickel transport system permease subunit
VVRDSPAIAAPVARTPRQIIWRSVRQDRVAMASLAFLALLVAVALLAPLILKLLGVPGPNVQNSSTLNGIGLPSGPSLAHPFGVDNLGRDVLARVLYGARVSLEVAVLATGLATLLGTAAGTVAAYYGGWVDTVIARTMDVVLSFPVLLLALGIASSCSGAKGCVLGIVRPGITVVVFVIASAGWPYIGRIIRGQVLSLRRREYVEAAASIGLSDWRIMVGELLPNLTGPLIVYVTLMVPTNILFEAALSFLGVGIQPPNPSWGSMIAQAIPTFQSAWWFMAFPGLALLLTVLAFNLLGDALQDAVRSGGVD